MMTKLNLLFKKHCAIFFSVGIVLAGCSSEHEKFVEKAEQEALRQNSQLAKYLFGQVIEAHPEKDHIRYRALRGLSEVCMTQLFEYHTAVKALEAIFEGYSQVERYQKEIRNLRMRAAQIYRDNLDRPDRALDVLSPLIPKTDKSIEERRALGRTYLSMGNYDEAKLWLMQAWEEALKQNSCDDLRHLQLDMIQVFSLRDLCEEALLWTEASFPKGCQPDEFAVNVEKAHCFEMTGEIAKALKLYEDLVAENPKNMRAHFFLENLKRRQKEKQQK